MTNVPEVRRVPRLIAELKRRRVFKVTVWYAMSAFVLLQIGEIVLPAFVDMRAWEDFSLRVLILVLAMGLPVAVVLGWVFDITPHGIERTEAHDSRPLVSPLTSLLIRSATIVLSAAFMVAGASWALRAAPDTSNFPDFPNRPAAPEDAQTAALTPALGDDRTSIAVLPFENRSPDDENDLFSEGIQEDILTQLAKIDELRVLGRNAVLPYRDQEVNARVMGQELGVETVLLGSVRWQEDQIRISTQLIDTQTEEQLWAETYDRQLDDVFAVQTEVARNIADALQLELSANEVTQLANTPTENVDAYRGYREVVRRLDELDDDASEAVVDSLIGFTDSLMGLDSTFAGLYLARSALFSRLEDSTSAVRAEVELQKALELNPNLTDAVSVIGSERFFRGIDEIPGGERMARLFAGDGSGVNVTIGPPADRPGTDGVIVMRDGETRSLNDQVQALLAQGEVDSATEILESLRSVSPANITPYAWEIQIALSSHGDVQRANEIVMEAFEHVRADRVIGLLNRHSTLIREGDFAETILETPLRDRGGPRSAIASSRYDVLMARGHQLRFDDEMSSARARYDSALVFALQLPDEGPVALMRDLRVAEAMAYAGRGEEAVASVRATSSTQGTDRLDFIRSNPDTGMQWARVLAVAGENDAAISELELLTGRFPEIVTPALIRYGEQWDRLRPNARFQQLIRPQPQ